MIRIVDISLNHTYRFDDCATDEEAVIRATEIFHNNIPNIRVRGLLPCELDGECPYPSNYSCNRCKEEN